MSDTPSHRVQVPAPVPAITTYTEAAAPVVAESPKATTGADDPKNKKPAK